MRWQRRDRSSGGERPFVALCLILCLCHSGCGDPLKDVPKPSGRVLMIGLDGATWDVIDPLIAQGRLPNLARLSREGSRGPLTSIEGKVSPTLFTTIATGKTPEQHGILDFMQKGKPLYNSDRRVRALWNIVSDRGGTVNVVSWFTTWPADVVKGAFISDRSEGALPGGASPRSLDVLAERASRDLPKEEAKRQAERLYGPPIPAGMASADLLREYDQYERQNAHYYRLDRLRLAWAEELLRTQPAELNVVFFKGIDPISHRGWIFLHPDQFPPRFHPPPAALARYGETIHRYYEVVDEAIGRLIDAAPPGTDIVIVSDHGFGAWTQGADVVYYLNSLLARSGFIVTDAEGLPDASRSILFDVTEFWNESRTRRLLQVNPDLAAGHAEDELLGRLRALRTPGGVPIFAEVKFTRPDLIVTELDPRLAQLDDHPDGAGLVTRRFANSGWHLPNGVVLLAGPHARAGARLAPADLYDISPTVLRLLGLPGAGDMQGRVLEEGLRPEALGPALPAVETYETGKPIERLEGDALPRELDTEFQNRLRSLGYIR